MAAPLQAVGTHGFSSVMALLGPQRLILDYVVLFQGCLSPLSPGPDSPPSFAPMRQTAGGSPAPHSGPYSTY